MTSQTPGASPSLRGYCDACGYSLARRWIPDVQPGPKASETLEDRGHFEILPYRDGEALSGGAIASTLALLAKDAAS